MPSARLAASRTVAKAGTSRSVEGGAVGELLAELVGPGAQLGVGQPADLGLQRGDLGGAGPQRLDAAIVGRAEDFAGDAAETDHPMVLSIRDLPGWERRPNPPCLFWRANSTTKGARKSLLDAKSKDR